MPSSRPNTIPTVIHLIRQLKPKSILDVGIGFGKWGHLFREYTDILEAENDPSRYERKNWKVRIDGIEGYAAYVTEMHRFIYNEVHIGNASELIRTLPSYDIIFMGDIIEHFAKEVGTRLLGDAVEKAGQAVIVSTPKYETEQPDLCGNELERHRSLWSAKDFRNWKGSIVTTIDRSILLAVIVKPGIAAPSCKPPSQSKPADTRRLQQTKAELIRLIPSHESFILVDEEQIRGELPHASTIPFMEREGRYWGPPPDDQSAIVELERLRGLGAKFIAFTWPAFWWLDHYSGLREHLRSHFRCIQENECLVVFDLAADSLGSE